MPKVWRGEWSGAGAQGAAISESPTHPPLRSSHPTGRAARSGVVLRCGVSDPWRIWRFARVRVGDSEIAAPCAPHSTRSLASVPFAPLFNPNPTMKNFTQRRKGAKIRGFGSYCGTEIVHPAGEQYFTRLPFVSSASLRLCAFA